MQHLGIFSVVRQVKQAIIFLMSKKTYIIIHGRQPAIGRAEIEAIYGADAVMPFSLESSILKTDRKLRFDNLGGSIKALRVIRELKTDKWGAIEKEIGSHLNIRCAESESRLSYGISTYGKPRISGKAVAASALRIKKSLKKSGRSVRMVPHSENPLNSATVLHNKLTVGKGVEIVIVGDGKTTYLCETSHIQNVDAYAKRDHERPMRDAKVGMLPPKLAQIIINLASQGSNQEDGEKRIILDPFCGTGVLLQEALLMGFGQYGTDIEPRMIEYTTGNLSWIASEVNKPVSLELEVADASKHTWTKPFDIVAGETYLGQPLSKLPPSDQLSKIMHEVNQLHHRFLGNIAKQIPSGTRLCMAIPAWRGRKEFLHLTMLDYLDDLGYNRMSFEHSSNEDLIYHREDQVVARELLVLIRK